MDRAVKIREEITKVSAHSKTKSDEHGEVFTPFALTEQMCDALPTETWVDQKKTFLDPCAGNGNMTAIVVQRLMEGLSSHIPDEDERYKHIMEKQIFMCELQRESAANIERIFNPNRDLKLNLYVGDFLFMPENFFDRTH